MRGSAWELKFDAERGLLGGFGGLVGRILRVWKALGGSKCRTARVWKLKTSINTSHLLGFGDGKALGCKINRILRVWKALGGLKCRILRVWKLKTSKNISNLFGFGRPRAFESNPDPW